MSFVLVVFCSILGATTSSASTHSSPFTEGWRFSLGEHDDQVTLREYDDSGWQEVRIPHDWAITGPFAEQEHGATGKLPWKGVGWYRKSFGICESDTDRRVYLDFDGVMATAKVYVNGSLAGEWDYGYTSFRVDATPFVVFGENNVVAVRVDTRQWGSRWYPGAGIYRRVTLSIKNDVHVAHWGCWVTTPEVTDNAARVRIATTVDNHRAAAAGITVETAVLDAGGEIVVQEQAPGTIPEGGSVTLVQDLVVDHPQLWDITSPTLYTAQTVVRIGEAVVDASSTEFGIRTFAFTADDGFHLNGRRVQLYGVNLHHDQGPLGAAFYPRAAERQLEIMREIGVNAIRTSHNPPAPELLALCDRMGFVVWDEGFDKWDHTAGRHDGLPPLKPFAERHLGSMVRRDRNHPSVVVWSIGNEVNPGGEAGITPELVTMLSAIVRDLDTTRPVGMGCHIPELAAGPTFASLDLTGWNYARRYATYREHFPDKPIIYSESASALSTRGYYELDLPRRKTDYSQALQVSSYDLNAAPWSDIPDLEFKLMSDDSFVAGEMVWTGFDYIGEPTPFDQEARSSYFGIVDLCGIPKDRYYLYRSVWRPDVLTLHILPHWNWEGHEGDTVPVFVYTNGDEAELFLNGRSLGRRRKGQLPEQVPNFAQSAADTASTAASGSAPAMATDGDRETRWLAGDGDDTAWLQVDLGTIRDIGFLALDLEREEKLYSYTVSVATGDDDWHEVVDKPQSSHPQWGGPTRVFHQVETRGRYVRIDFVSARDGAPLGIRELGVYESPIESSYYEPTYTYRLRWNDVVYEPGELKVVAYREGNKIGEAVQRTAGPAAALRLRADRSRLDASGDDLCYVVVEAVDEQGNLAPNADNLVSFSLEGPAAIAGVGNGNPLSFEPFQASQRRLFFGKALVILRALQGQEGTIRLTASSEGLDSATVTAQAVSSSGSSRSLRVDRH